MLSLKQIENVCLINDKYGKRCRYLTANFTNNQTTYVCLKLSPLNKKKIDEQIEEYKKYNSPKNEFRPPLGDNCSGYNISLYVEQGYDIKD